MNLCTIVLLFVFIWKCVRTILPNERKLTLASNLTVIINGGAAVDIEFGIRPSDPVIVQGAETLGGKESQIVGVGTDGQQLSVGTKFETVKYFRGRASITRYKSNCPEPTCCRHAPAELEDKWGGMIRPTPRLNSSLLAAMPQNGFLGIEQREILEFLEGQKD